MIISFTACKNKVKDDLNNESAKSEDNFVNPGIMTPEVLWRLGRVSDVQVSPDGKTILYGITRYNIIDNKGNRDLFTISIEGKDVKQITQSEGGEFNAIWRPDGSKIGFLAADTGGIVQLWEMNPDGSNLLQISKDKDGFNGFKYSPDGQQIMFVKEVKVDKNIHDLYPDLPLANAMVYDELMYRHWDHWADEFYSHVFIAPFQNNQIGELKDLMAGERYSAPREPFGGIEDINWSPDGTKLAVSYKRLSGKDYAISTNSEIYLYDLKAGTSQNLTFEGYEGYDNEPVWSPDGKMLVWSSMAKPGFEADKERIMIHFFETAKTIDFSTKFDQSSHGFVFSKDSKTLYFISGIEATYQIYSLDLASGSINAITKGDHDYQSVAIAGNQLVGAKMSMKLPTEIFAIGMDGSEKQITFTNRDLLEKVKMAEVEKRWIATTDGKKELVWVVYPPNFDKSKKYPAILYCQGGPQSAVSQFFSYRWNFQVIASNGYIVVAPNRRGLPTFGQEWNDQISGDYGGQNMKDYLTAIDTLAAEDYVDENNLGAVGASYGGYSIYWLAGHHQGRFKALISHCGIYDLPSMYAATEETFFVNNDMQGAPWDKPQPKSFKDFNPANFVGDWDTPILVISGGKDFRIPYTQSMQAFNAAQLNDVPSRFLFFPEESHFVLKPQNSILWQREFKSFLDKYLKANK
jgi:dipeptidyl aminopeptidase/acylaminoacyl peptidase